MNEDDQTVPEDQGLSDQVLKIERVSGRYASSIGLLKDDIIAGVDGVPFLDGIKAFDELFDETDFDEDDVERHKIVLTIRRGEAFFNVVCHHKIKCKFVLVANPDPEPSIDLQEKLQNAQDDLILEYIVYHDNQKNVHLLECSRSLIAMVAPPLWLLNQRMPEAALAATLAAIVAFVAHPILGGLYYALLCIYVGRDQHNLAVVFMNYRRMIHFQSIAAVNELEAQRTVRALDPDFYFSKPAEGLEQPKKRRRRKTNDLKTRATPEIST